MKEYLGRNCKIHLNRNGKDLFYTATIDEITRLHLTFTDVFKKTYTFRISDLIEMKINE